MTWKQARKAQTMLDTLQPGAVVLDTHGHAWQMGRVIDAYYWYRAYGDSSNVSTHELATLGPFTVLHTAPTTDETKPKRPNVEAVFVEMHGGIGSP